MASQIQSRRDTLANWTSVNPILAQGEIAVEQEVGSSQSKIKVGNGINNYLDLPYISGFTPLEGDGITISTSGANFVFSVDDYIGSSEVASISGDLQTQINTKQPHITLVAGNNVTITESPADTWTISASVSGSSQQANTVAFLATTNAGQSLAHNTANYIVFEDEEIDTNNAYSTSTGVFTVPVSGYYFFASQVRLEKTKAKEVFMQIVKNDTVSISTCQLSETATSSDPTVSYVGDRDTIQASGITLCNVNDTFKIQVFHTNVATASRSLISTSEYNRFFGYRIQ